MAALVFVDIVLRLLLGSMGGFRRDFGHYSSIDAAGGVGDFRCLPVDGRFLPAGRQRVAAGVMSNQKKAIGVGFRRSEGLI
jgi:hypothetical protein